MNPDAKWTRLMNLAWTMDNAIGVYMDILLDQRLYKNGVFRCWTKIRSMTSSQ